MKKLRAIACAIVIASLPAAAVAALPVQSSRPALPYGAEVRLATEKAAPTIPVDQSPAAALTHAYAKAVADLVALQNSKLPKEQIGPQAMRLMATIQANNPTQARIKAAPDYDIVKPKMSRVYVIRTQVFRSLMFTPNPGEFYRLDHIDRWIPPLVLPALHSYLSSPDRWMNSAFYSLGDHLEFGWKVGEYRSEFSEDYKTRLEQGVPGAWRSLAAWNATVPPRPDDSSQLMEGPRRLAHEEAKATPRNQDNGHTQLAPGVYALAVAMQEKMLIVYVINTTTSPFRFRPENYMYLPGRKIAPLVARPFLDGPLSRRPEAVCLDAVPIPADPAPARQQKTGPIADPFPKGKTDVITEAAVESLKAVGHGVTLHMLDNSPPRTDPMSQAASAIANVIPGLGQFKALGEAISGKNQITNAKTNQLLAAKAALFPKKSRPDGNLVKEAIEDTVEYELSNAAMQSAREKANPYLPETLQNHEIEEARAQRRAEVMAAQKAEGLAATNRALERIDVERLYRDTAAQAQNAWNQRLAQCGVR